LRVIRIFGSAVTLLRYLVHQCLLPIHATDGRDKVRCRT